MYSRTAKIILLEFYLTTVFYQNINLRFNGICRNWNFISDWLQQGKNDFIEQKGKKRMSLRKTQNRWIFVYMLSKMQSRCVQRTLEMENETAEDERDEKRRATG